MKKVLLAAALFAIASPAAADGSGGRYLQIVSPNQSIQTAIDRAAEGGWIFVLPGTYRETADATNGLNITRGVHLVGLSTPKKKVVLENSGAQRNGIVAVPAAHTECMSCHASMAPPFELLPGVDPEPDVQRSPRSTISRSAASRSRTSATTASSRATSTASSSSTSTRSDNQNYGIFPTAVEERADHAQQRDRRERQRHLGRDLRIWSAVTHNLVEGNVNGFEVSNSEEILLAHNEARGNTVGMAILFLPDIFDERPDSRRITVRNNHVHDNNKPNTARPGSILSTVPSGTGILYLGVDDSVISKNVVERPRLRRNRDRRLLRGGGRRSLRLLGGSRHLARLPARQRRQQQPGDREPAGRQRERRGSRRTPSRSRPATSR